MAELGASALLCKFDEFVDLGGLGGGVAEARRGGGSMACVRTTGPARALELGCICPFVSGPRCTFLEATEWCTGGGSNIPRDDLGRSDTSTFGCLGRAGSWGGCSSGVGLPGGLLNGDVSSTSFLGVDVPCEPWDEACSVATVLSLLGAGGGGGFESFSRLNSPDRLGGGGEGAFARRGERGAGTAGVGVVGRAVTTVGLRGVEGVEGVGTESTRAGCSPTGTVEARDFGGDWGGCIVTAGG
jgi:hypothetical protein